MIVRESTQRKLEKSFPLSNRNTHFLWFEHQDDIFEFACTYFHKFRECMWIIIIRNMLVLPHVLRKRAVSKTFTLLCIKMRFLLRDNYFIIPREIEENIFLNKSVLGFLCNVIYKYPCMHKNYWNSQKSFIMLFFFTKFWIANVVSDYFT